MLSSDEDITQMAEDGYYYLKQKKDSASRSSSDAQLGYRMDFFASDLSSLGIPVFF